jgi:restriction endonuclease
MSHASLETFLRNYYYRFDKQINVFGDYFEKDEKENSNCMQMRSKLLKLKTRKLVKISQTLFYFSKFQEKSAFLL